MSKTNSQYTTHVAVRIYIYINFIWWMACSHHSSSIRRVCSGDTHICVQKIYRSTLFVSIRWQHRCRHASANVLYLYVSHDRAGRSTGVCKTSIACRLLFFSLFVDRVRCGSKQKKTYFFESHAYIAIDAYCVRREHVNGENRGQTNGRTAMLDWRSRNTHKPNTHRMRHIEIGHGIWRASNT